ncbi:hypothetical protein [Erythrobacter sp.]|uniref:hypothetical protein n=1 Tax=Erythrobacter sp. TaxID=1042 RepID=UPI002EB700AE|nr:hypothetical protein [Erythrobacter sp.]
MTGNASINAARSYASFAVSQGRLGFTRRVVTTIAVLLALDAGFLLIHCLGVLMHHGAIGPSQPQALSSWRIDRDGSWSEYYEYAKTALIAALALVCAHYRGLRSFGPIALTAILLLLDNSLEMHERSKAIIMPATGLSKGLAEFAYIAIVGFVVVAWLGFAALRAAPGDRVVVALFIAMLAILGGFGGGVDLLHTALGSTSRKLDLILAFVEDGGELVTLSLGCALLAAAAAGRAAQGREC